jgi:ribonuclease P protein component
MERLTRRTDFRAAAAGLRAPAGAFTLQARPRGDTRSARVGFTVSKQVGNAVERNRVRRRLREIVRLAPAAALRAGHDYVLIGRRAALAAPFGAMRLDLAAALERVHDAAAKSAANSDTGGAGAALPRSLHQAGSARPQPRRGVPPKRHGKDS